MTSYNEFFENYPDLVFIKTYREVQTKEDITDDNFIIEEDTPALIHGKTQIIPLCEDKYPLVFKEATAMQAGLYAVDICEKQEWDITPSVVNEILRHIEEAFEEQEKI